jgi:cytochrome c oxidase cbb3-type subunit III
MKAVINTLRKSSLALVAGLLLMAGAPAVAQDAVQGKKLFDGNCAACHSMDADIVGPALKDVHERRGDEWLHKFIKNSQELIQSGDKDAVAIYEQYKKMPMPAFDGSLSDADIDHVIAYIKEASAAAPVAEVQAVTTEVQAEAPVAIQDIAFADLPPVLLLTMGLVALVILLVILTLFILFRLLVPMMGDSIYDEDFRTSFAGRVLFLMRGDTTIMTGQDRNVIHSDHDFDGIQEYDNDLPPWWKYMFYATIVFAVGYMLHYHVFRTGALQEEEYEMEMQMAALLASRNVEDPNAVTNFELLTDAGALESGKALYLQNCAACHGQAGEGTVGPNLTDEYWIHGGNVNDIYRTVKFGVPSKGMVPWQGKMTKDQMLEVSSYIVSLKGSNPPNAKEAQGEKE